ncbi:MAG: helix-turn-helix transcriptional regulator [Chitinophagaceae bacterium]|nr:helix-turn-helix transcriptional regulator [Chitinophagaceae bacterium]MBL0336083.1 helix-turn-helix transcriptional regulator [Chitinophagaceae bacterium]
MTEPKFLSRLGARIKEIRLQKEISQHELASRCNFEKASMSRIESGKTNVTVLTLRKISNALEVDMSDFFVYDPAEAAVSK